MYRTVALFFAAAALGIVQASFVLALPDTAAKVMTPLFMIVALVTAFRTRGAYVAAVGAGMTMDMLSSLPAGTNVVTLLAVTAVTVFLFHHVFSHRSWTGTVGLNIAAFIVAHVVLAILSTLRASIIGLEHAWLPTTDILKGFGAALLVQTGVITLILAINGIARRALTKRFILLR